MNARELMQAARSEGLLPPHATDEGTDAGPSWIVMTMGYFGALLVALLGLGVLALFSWGKIFSMPGSILCTLGFSAAGVMMLRPARALFWQQMAFSLLLVGQAMWLMGWGLHWELIQQSGLMPPLLGLLALQLTVAALTPVAWVNRLLGIAAAWTFLVLPFHGGATNDLVDLWWQSRWPGVNLWLLALAWALWCVVQTRVADRAWAARASALADGVAVALLLQPLVEYVLSGVGWGSARFLSDGTGAPVGELFGFSPMVALRIALVVACALWLLGVHWKPSEHPGVRRAWPLLALSYAALLLACWFTPVEAIAVIGTVALGTGRRRLLWLALAALLFQLASFYYLLSWSLMQKAWVLLAAGGCLASVLAVLRLLGQRDRQKPSDAAPPPHALARRQGQGRIAAAVTLATAFIAVGLVQWDVRQKEQVIAQGQKVFVALAPVDPRSLMQGDYMALNFALPPAVRQQLDALSDKHLSMTQHALAQLDARGVARILRLTGSDEQLPSGDIRLPLRYLKGQWTLVTDAYFFPEGQAQRFANARFGEFRVLPGGRALLVGLADAALQPMAPEPSPGDPSRP